MTNELISPIEGETAEKLAIFLGNPDDQGWWFPAGDPEFWKFSDRLLVPSGQALDLGLGEGRTALPLALNGMAVTGFEINPRMITTLEQIRKAAKLPLIILNQDLIKSDFGQNRYDTIVAGQIFVHFPSRLAAFDVIDRTIDALIPGGHFWLRTAGKYDSSWEQLNDFADYYPEITKIDDDVFEAPCSCSGEIKMEPQLFLDPMQVLYFLNDRGMKIVHTELMPKIDGRNIMYGEDFNRTTPIPRVGGMITILAQK